MLAATKKNQRVFLAFHLPFIFRLWITVLHTSWGLIVVTKTTTLSYKEAAAAATIAAENYLRPNKWWIAAENFFQAFTHLQVITVQKVRVSDTRKLTPERQVPKCGKQKCAFRKCWFVVVGIVWKTSAWKHVRLNSIQNSGERWTAQKRTEKCSGKIFLLTAKILCTQKSETSAKEGLSNGMFKAVFTVYVFTVLVISWKFSTFQCELELFKNKKKIRQSKTF